jgi:hypothetical protein
METFHPSYRYSPSNRPIQFLTAEMRWCGIRGKSFDRAFHNEFSLEASTAVWDFHGNMIQAFGCIYVEKPKLFEEEIGFATRVT